MIYDVVKKIIGLNKYNSEDLQTKLDVFLAAGRITKEQYEELTELVSETSTPLNNKAKYIISMEVEKIG